MPIKHTTVDATAAKTSSAGDGRSSDEIKHLHLIKFQQTLLVCCSGFYETAEN